MRERTKNMAARLSDKGMDTVEIFFALSPEDWQMQVYSEGANWAVRDILCHFVSAERGFLRIFEDIKQGGEGSPEEFDLDRFNESEVAKMADLTPEELLTQFTAAREAMVAFVLGLEDADLDLEGRHPFFGMDRMEKFLKLIYRHNMIHQRDIRQALADR